MLAGLWMFATVLSTLVLWLFLFSPPRSNLLIIDDSYEQGLEEKIQLVPIDLQDRPAWYKEKVYPANKVKF